MGIARARRALFSEFGATPPRLRWHVSGCACLIGGIMMVGGCLDRPLAPQQPKTSNVVTESYRTTRVDKIDLLFLIDNSASMADKQEILALAVPDLLKRLTQPPCIDSDGKSVGRTGDKTCPTGAKLEFEPVTDIHIGVITSSLGGQGADSCSDPTWGSVEKTAQGAHLLTDALTAGETVPSWQDKGFLYWDPNQKAGMPAGTQPGEKDPGVLINNLTNLVRGAGQDGCGYEASLEAWYRFLVDPAPFKKLVPASCHPDTDPTDQSCRAPEGIDDTLLKQRADFLRPDSLVAVIMLSDENDCSLMPAGQNYMVLQTHDPWRSGDKNAQWNMPRATSACTTDPTSSACTSCSWPGAPADDPECAKGSYQQKEDDLNLRCYRQKQRFGLDALWPIKRYVNGLTRRQFTRDDQSSGTNPGFRAEMDYNPLFCPAYEERPDPKNPGSTTVECKTLLRDPSLVFFAGIVGVPWQDIAVDPKDLAKGYRGADELGWNQSAFEKHNTDHPDAPKSIPAGVDDQATVWEQILGKLDGSLNIDWTVEPKDPLMIESIEPRDGVNLATGQALALPDATSPLANVVNGHERLTGGTDLQYACVFNLPKSRECTEVNASATKDPLCQDDSGGYGTVQRRAKAYPGRRQLAVLKGIEPSQAIVASICAENVTDPGSEDQPRLDYGYRPAVAALIDRLKSALQGTCWKEPLSPDEHGRVQCVALEVTKGEQQPDGSIRCAPCEDHGSRKAASEAAVRAVLAERRAVENKLNCVCEIPQMKEEDTEGIDLCIGSEQDAPVRASGEPVNGWCYIDPEQNGGRNARLVQACPDGQKQMIRFVGTEGSPEPGSVTFLQCAGRTFGKKSTSKASDQ